MKTETWPGLKLHPEQKNSESETLGNEGVDIEDQFWNDLETLPDELRLVWEEKYTNSAELGPDFFAAFSQFFKARALAQRGVIETQEGISKEVREEISLVHDVMESVFRKREEFFLGDGRTAEVYIFPFAPSICIKFMIRQTGVDNSIAEEVDVLNQLRGFSLNSVRVPDTYFRQVQKEGMQYYGMERVMGRDLFQIAQYPDKNPEFVALAKTLDRKVVQADLLAYIEAMYTQFGITHGDLRHGNLMLTTEGEFILIDFGKAKVQEVGEDMEERYKSDRLILIEHLKIFFAAIDQYDETKLVTISR